MWCAYAVGRYVVDVAVKRLPWLRNDERFPLGFSLKIQDISLQGTRLGWTHTCWTHSRKQRRRPVPLHILQSPSFRMIPGYDGKAAHGPCRLRREQQGRQALSD